MWTEGLNSEQAQAVRHNYGPLLILAGAGSGKTTVLVSRTGRLISEQVAKPENILVLTFTNKAARELKHRVQLKIGAAAKNIWAGTFHSFGLRILREFHELANLPNHFGVIDSSDSMSILRELVRDIKIAGKDKFDLERVLELINQFRVEGRLKTQGFDEYHELAQMLLPKFVKKLEVLGVTDFDGLLLGPIKLFKEHPQTLEKIQRRYTQVMVDEFQDTNKIQMQLIHELIKEHRNLTVVGDDDQSIYGWRGAEIKNILNFPKVYTPCEVIRLEKNYRSTSAILDVANGVIQKNKFRHGKVLQSVSQAHPGEPPEVFVFENEDEESQFVRMEIQSHISQGMKPSEIAVLYRSNSQGGLIESELRQYRIPYTVSGGTAFFDRREVKDTLAYLKMSLHPNDVGLRRIINTPNRGIGDTTLEKINKYAIDHKISFLKAAHEWKKIGIAEKTGESIDHFFGFIKSFSQRIISSEQSGAQLTHLMREVGYKDFILQTSSSPDAAEKKWMLVEIFSRILDSFILKGGRDLKSLREFVDAMELRDDQDDEKKEHVSLMTLHASKGLEFPVVFLLGVEEDLLPHKNLGLDIDEERRLFYVGLTRAKKKLILSRCKFRKRNGVSRPVSPSRFLLEIGATQVKLFENGVRPVSGEAREKMLSDFFSRIENKSNKGSLGK